MSILRERTNCIKARHNINIRKYSRGTYAIKLNNIGLSCITRIEKIEFLNLSRQICCEISWVHGAF